jgi:hypothetical protein
MLNQTLNLIENIIVVNGHGSKTDKNFDIGENILLAPDSLDTSYVFSVDTNWSIEKNAKNGKLKPVANGKWTSYAQQTTIPDVKLAPWKMGEVREFSKRISSELALWSNIDDANGLYLDRDQNAVLVVKKENNYVYLNHQQAANYFSDLSKCDDKKYLQYLKDNGVPIFLYAPKVNKIKILEATSLSEVMKCTNVIDGNKMIILATCNAAKENKNVTLKINESDLPIANMVKLTKSIPPKVPPQVIQYKNAPASFQVAKKTEPVPQVKLYKALNGELAVKFETKDLRDKFLEAIGGVQSFPTDDIHNGGKKAPILFNDNQTTLFFPAYTAQQGELAVVFPTIEMRTKFINSLLGSNENNNVASIYPNQKPLYINDKNIHQKGTSIIVTPESDLQPKKSISPGV